MIAKGIIRIKCVDLSNWAARENLFNTQVENVRFSTEGMDTVIVYVEKTDSLEKLLAEFVEAMNVSIDLFGVMLEDLDKLMKAVKAVLMGGTETVNQSFKMQLNQPVPPYIEVVINIKEEDPAPVAE